METPDTDRQALMEEMIRLRRRIDELEDLELRYDLLLEELERKKEFSEAVLNSLGEAIYVTDADSFQTIFCNKVFLREYGLENEEVIGRPCYQMTQYEESPCPPESDRCPSLQALKTGRAHVSELIFPGPGGREVYIENSTRPVRDKSGKIAWLVHVQRNITERKLTEAKLKEAIRELGRSNAFLRNLIRSSVDAVIAADLTGRILIFTKVAEQITGYTEKEALQEIDIRDIYPGDGAREIMRRLRSKGFGGRGKLKSDDVMLLCKDGSTVPIELSAAIVYEDDVEVATVGFFYDLREKQRIKRELDKTRIELLQAEKLASIGKLAAGVAHQLNNPLGGITIFGHLLLEENDLDPKVRSDVERILNDAERCREIVKELLQFARQKDNVARLCNVNEALLRTVFLLVNQPIFHDITIVKELEESLPGVMADVHQISQAFTNIILNAADAMDGHGELTLKTYLHPTESRIVIDFCDTGPGIPDDVLPSVFDPFFTTKEEGKGTGLGLSVAFGIIENHNGKILAGNRPEGGAYFSIELPLYKEPKTRMGT